MAEAAIRLDDDGLPLLTIERGASCFFTIDKTDDTTGDRIDLTGHTGRFQIMSGNRKDTWLELTMEESDLGRIDLVTVEGDAFPGRYEIELYPDATRDLVFGTGIFGFEDTDATDDVEILLKGRCVAIMPFLGEVE